MRKITLFAALALLAALPATAQKNALSKFVGRSATAPTSRTARHAAAMRAAAANSAADPIWRATATTIEVYIDGEWLSDMQLKSEYRADGLIAAEYASGEEGVVKTSYAYDANGQVVEIVEETDEDGTGSYYKSGRKTYTYDPVVTTFRTSTANYVWDDVESDWTPYGNQWVKAVERNTAGNVTSLTVSTPYMGQMTVAEQTLVTYGTDGRADTWLFRQVDPYSDGWDKGRGYRDIVWENTDGQLLESDETFVLGNNRIKSATRIYNDEVDGSFNVTYADGKRDFEAIRIYESGTCKQLHRLTTLDANGSYREEFVYYEAAEDAAEGWTITGSDYAEEYFDEHGNTTLYETFYAEADGQPEQVSGSRSNNEYDAEGRLVRITMSDWEGTYDEDSGALVSGEYTPSIRLTYSDFADVTAGVSAPTTGSDAPAAVYTLQGRRIAGAAKLPAGVYIVNGHKVLVK